MNRHVALRGSAMVGCLILTASLCFCGNPAKPTAAEVKLCASVGIDSSTCAAIKSEAGTEITPLRLLNADYREGKPVGVAFTVPYKRSDQVAQALRNKLKPKGYLGFIIERNYDIGKKPDEIGVMKTKDQFDIVRVRGTEAPNYDIGHAAILAKLKKWERKYSFEIVGADTDWVELKFRTVPPNLNAFAKDVYRFCPDSVDQGAGSVEALVREIAKTKTLMLWWD